MIMVVIIIRMIMVVIIIRMIMVVIIIRMIIVVIIIRMIKVVTRTLCNITYCHCVKKMKCVVLCIIILVCTVYYTVCNCIHWA